MNSLFCEVCNWSGPATVALWLTNGVPRCPCCRHVTTPLQHVNHDKVDQQDQQKQPGEAPAAVEDR